MRFPEVLRGISVLLVVGSSLMAFAQTSADKAEIPVAAKDEIIKMPQTGVGRDEPAATKDACRKVVLHLASEPLATIGPKEEKTLAHGTLVAAADGLVKKCEVTGTRQLDTGDTEVQILASIYKKDLQDSIGKIREWLRLNGRPTILVDVVEERTDLDREAKIQTSVFSAVLKAKLLESGFKVVEKSQLPVLAQREVDKYGQTADMGRLLRAISDSGASIYVTVNVRATTHDLEIGQPPARLYSAAAGGSVTAYFSDTAITLSSIGDREGKSQGSNLNRERAAELALIDLAKKVAPAMTKDILRRWADMREIKVSIKGITDKNLDYIKRQLAGTEGIGEVTTELSAGTGFAKVQTILPLDRLKNVLAKKLPVTVTDYFGGEVQVEWKPSGE